MIFKCQQFTCLRVLIAPIRLFVIMGIWSLLTIEIPVVCITGVPWILDLVTSVIQHEHGFDDSCYLTISLDAVNLLKVDTLRVAIKINKAPQRLIPPLGSNSDIFEFENILVAAHTLGQTS